MNFKKYFNGSVLVFEPTSFSDERGFFLETFNTAVFSDLLGNDVNFVQDNHSRSKKNVLRGLHMQAPPFSQGKLVRVSKGSVFDVVVDFRLGSTTFGEHLSVVLSDENHKQIWIPEGFGHGFLCLEDDTDFCYKVSDFYKKESEITVSYDDPSIRINWPGDNFIVSQSDKKGIKISELAKIVR